MAAQKAYILSDTCRVSVYLSDDMLALSSDFPAIITTMKDNVDRIEYDMF